MTLIGSIKVSFEVKGDYLVVEASGSNDSLKSLIELSIAVHNKALETQCNYHLLDFSKLELTLKWADGFNLVRMYENSMPEFSRSTAASVFNESSLEFVKYWQEIGQSRGFDIQLFPTRDEAEKWLIKKINAATD